MNKLSYHTLTGIKWAPFFLLVLFFGCKKHHSQPPNPYDLPIDYRYTYNMEIKQQYTILSNSLSPAGCFATAIFYRTDHNHPKQFAKPEYADTVFFNSTILPANQNYFAPYYIDTLSQPVYPPFSWNVKGAGDIPSFTEIITDSLPAFIDYTTIPDSIRPSGTYFPIGTTHADSVSILIDANTGNYWGKTISASISGITLNAPSSTSIQTEKITFTLYRHYLKAVGDKTLSFRVSSNYAKTIKIVP